MAIGHDSSRVEFVRAEMGSFLKDHAGGDLLAVVNAFEAEGFVAIFVSFDLSFPITVPPRDIPPDTLLATLTYRILPGAEGDVVLVNESNVFGNPRIPNIYTSDDPAIPQGVQPVLGDGLISIGFVDTFSMSIETTVDAQVEVMLKGSSTKALRAFSAALTYDAAVLSLATADAAAAFAGTVWEDAEINTLDSGTGLIEVQALRSAVDVAPPGDDLLFLNLTFDVLDCTGLTGIGFGRV